MIGIIAGAAAGLLAAEFVRENCCMLAVRQDTIDQPAYTGRPLSRALFAYPFAVRMRISATAFCVLMTPWTLLATHLLETHLSVGMASATADARF